MAVVLIDTFVVLLSDLRLRIIQRLGIAKKTTVNRCSNWNVCEIKLKIWKKSKIICKLTTGIPTSTTMIREMVVNLRLPNIAYDAVLIFFFFFLTSNVAD